MSRNMSTSLISSIGCRGLRLRNISNRVNYDWGNMHYGERTCYIHVWISNMFGIKHRNILYSYLITPVLDIIILAVLCNNYISHGQETHSELVLQIVHLFCMITLCRLTWSSPKFSSDGYEEGSWASPCPLLPSTPVVSDHDKGVTTQEMPSIRA